MPPVVMAGLFHAVVEPEACITAIVHILNERLFLPFCGNGKATNANHAQEIFITCGRNFPISAHRQQAATKRFPYRATRARPQQFFTLRFKRSTFMHIPSRTKRLHTPIHLVLNTALIAGIIMLTAACAGGDDAQSATASQTTRATNGINAATPATEATTTGSQLAERSDQARATVAPNRPVSGTATTGATAPTSSGDRPTTATNTTSIPPATETPEAQKRPDPRALYLLDVAFSHWTSIGLRSRTHVALGHYADKAIEVDPTITTAYILRAHRHNRFDRFDLALADLDRAFQNLGEVAQPTSGDDGVWPHLHDRNTGEPTTRMLDYAHVMRAYALTRKGQYDAARQSLAAQSGSTSEAKSVQMLIDHYTGNFEAAAHNCCRNVNIYSIGEGGFDDYPQPDLDVEIKLDPSNIEALSERAIFNLWLGDYDAASADLDALNAAGAPARVSRGIRDGLHRATKDHEAVIRDYTEYLASQQAANLPDYRRYGYHFVRGRAYLETGQTGAAVSDFEQSLALRLSTPQQEQDQDRDFGRRISNIRYAVGLAHIVNGDHKSGLAAYCGQGATPICAYDHPGFTDSPQFYDSDDPWLHIYAGLARCAQRQGGDITCDARLDTLYRFEHAIELDQSNTMAHELRAVAHLAHHGVEDQRSDDYFEEALETYPDPAALYRFRIPVAGRGRTLGRSDHRLRRSHRDRRRERGGTPFPTGRSPCQAGEPRRRRIGLPEGPGTGLRPRAGPIRPHRARQIGVPFTEPIILESRKPAFT